MPSSEKFAQTLSGFGIDADVADEIQDGYAGITSKTPKKKKAAYFRRAVEIMDRRVPADAVRELMDANACCKTGARLKASKEFRRINEGLPLEEKLAKLRKAGYLNMGEPWPEPDGSLRINAVSYVYDGRYACACSNYRRVPRDYPVSRTYCMCCAGHFRFHYELMLGVRLRLREVKGSPLDTEGREPCVFIFDILEDGESGDGT